MSGEPNFSVLCQTFFRCYFVGAAYNSKGLQNIGLAYIMEPGLNSIYSDPAKRHRAWRRYTSFYNTHPFWTPLLVGVFLFMEIRIARGVIPETTLQAIKDTLVYTLSGVGDAFFGSALIGVWSIGATILAIHGNLGWFIALTIFLLVAAQVFKAVTFWLGYREGYKVLNRLKRWNFIDWSRRLKIFNAVLLAALWYLLARPFSCAGNWAISILLIVGSAVAMKRFPIPRELFVAALVIAFLVAGNDVSVCLFGD